MTPQQSSHILFLASSYTNAQLACEKQMNNYNYVSKQNSEREDKAWKELKEFVYGFVDVV